MSHISQLFVEIRAEFVVLSALIAGRKEINDRIKAGATCHDFLLKADQRFVDLAGDVAAGLAERFAELESLGVVDILMVTASSIMVPEIVVGDA